jgi:hypothetical protein
MEKEGYIPDVYVKNSEGNENKREVEIKSNVNHG